MGEWHDTKLRHMNMTVDPKGDITEMVQTANVLILSWACMSQLQMNQESLYKLYVLSHTYKGGKHLVAHELYFRGVLFPISTFQAFI